MSPQSANTVRGHLARGRLRRWAVKNFPSWLHPIARRSVLAGTSVVGRVFRALPGSSSSFGPPRRIYPTIESYARSHADIATYQELYPARDLRRPPPITLSSQPHANFVREYVWHAWGAGVATIRGGQVLTSTGAIISPDDGLIYDVSHTAASGDAAKHPIFLERKLPKIARFDGRLAVLTTFTSNTPKLYYFVHWLLDTLPRLHLLDKSGIAWDKLIAPQATKFHRETLSLLGITADRIISDPDLYLAAETLVVPSLPSLPVNPPYWVCDYLRQKFFALALTDSARALRPGRKLYLSREKAKTRKIANEAELLAATQPLGFEKIMLEDYSFLEQVRILQEADMIIAPHGAANASIVFCRPNTRFIEMFSPKYINVCYWSLCNEVGLLYGYLTGAGRISGSDAHEDVNVPIPTLLSLIDRMNSLPNLS